MNHRIAAIALLLAACGAPSTLESGVFVAGEEFDPALSEARLSLDAETQSAVLTRFDGDSVSFTVRELPQEEWVEVGTYPFARSRARTWAVTPAPLVLTGDTTFENPRLVTLNEGDAVILMGTSMGAELSVWFARE